MNLMLAYRHTLLAVILCLSVSACSEGVNLSSAAQEQNLAGGEQGNNVPVPNDIDQDRQTGFDLRVRAAHNENFEGTYYSGSGQCADCHNGLTDNQGNDISMVSDWSTSMMANSSRDPYWLAKVAAEAHRNPALSGELEQTCTKCHAPMASDTAKKENLEIDLLSASGILSADNPLFDHAMEGVSCTLCHQMEDDGLLGTVEGTSGNFTVAKQDQSFERPAYGPYADPVGVRMQTQSGFEPRFGAHTATSETCAACHDFRTPKFESDAGGAGTARDFFPEQMVYSEWKNSAFAQDPNNQTTCQSCHMPEVQGSVKLSSSGTGIDRSGFSSHTFLGPNTVMQNILMNNADSLGVDVPASAFAEAIERNRAFIGTAASLKIYEAKLRNGQLTAQLNVRNLSGHKLPSGFISRRAFIHFVVSDLAGNVVFESGLEAADGSVSGVNSDASSGEFEAHHDLITSEEQVQVYEAVMGDVSNNVTHTLMNATSHLKDNRLLPNGFDKASAPEDIRTRGKAANDDNFDAGGDWLTYQVNVPEGDQWIVSATLVYQPLAFGHIQDLFEESQLPDVAFFKSLYNASTLKSEVIAADSLRVGPSQ